MHKPNANTINKTNPLQSFYKPVTLNPQHAIQQQQAQSDTAQQIKSIIGDNAICSKTGALFPLNANLDLLAVVADATSLQSACYSYSTQLASYTNPAWINTGPDNLNVLRIADPYGFAVYCIQYILQRGEFNSTETTCADFERNKMLQSIRVAVENFAPERTQVEFINSKLSAIIAITSPRNIQKELISELDISALNHMQHSRIIALLRYLSTLEQKLIKSICKSGLTPTLLRQQREKNGGSSAMAASYSRDSGSAKRKWLKYISEYDKSFAHLVYTNTINLLTANDLQMPRDDQHFTDVQVTDTKLAAIKLRIESKQKSRVFDDILSDVDLSDINNMDR